MSTATTPTDVKLTKHDATGQWMKRIGKTKTKAGKLVPKTWYLGTDFLKAQHKAFVKGKEWERALATAVEEGFTGELTWEDAALLGDPYHGTGLPTTEEESKADPYGGRKLLLDEAYDNPDGTPKGPTVRAMAARYIAERKRHIGLAGSVGIKAHTFKVTEHRINRVLEFWPADKRLSEVNNGALQDIVIYWAGLPEVKSSGTDETEEKPRRISPETAIDYLNGLRYFLVWCAEQEDVSWLLPKNFRKVFKITPEPREKKRRLFTPAEIKTLWDACINPNARTADKGERRRLFILLGLNCGLYQSEIAALEKSHIELDGPTPFIERIREKTRKKNRMLMKTRHSLWPETVKLLRKYMADDNTAGPRGENLALLNEDGGPLVKLATRTDNIQMAWNRLLETLEDFPPCSFSNLRDTGAQYVETVGGEEVASMYLSHFGKRGVLNNYTSPVMAKLTAALDKFRTELVTAKVFTGATEPAA